MFGFSSVEHKEDVLNNVVKEKPLTSMVFIITINDYWLLVSMYILL